MILSLVGFPLLYDSIISKKENENMIEEVKLHLKDKFKISGYVEARGYDARYIKTYRDYLIAKNRGLLDKITIWKDEGPNKVVEGGIQQFIDVMIGSNILYPAFCQNGSGTNAVTDADIDLQTAITPRLAIAYKYRSGLSLKVDTFFDSTSENGTWAESSLWSALTGGIMYCRKLYSSSFAKTTANTSTVTWTITLAAV